MVGVEALGFTDTWRDGCGDRREESLPKAIGPFEGARAAKVV